ncbi:MAG: hypothetical protein COV60_01620 [Candidatus Magasanikbacteria bacterium CG11_big_fil_rev_8_21_14_0_20_43_7]|uniref:Uncharacterized protein n=1 Tax=Candidatus Magasanikbacteria bacterium CG11_big_fil_rev_8_21_14_0_20_43_7 TaxID=1974654 RepID=A0A2H0N2T9_9BACT|nr:MAG: hypothetical protein COV60_01620 [Candidatus Magasanikbacteria bacterium CG11_big_fil_rev_8_21_14_0_20_43_7]
MKNNLLFFTLFLFVGVMLWWLVHLFVMKSGRTEESILPPIENTQEDVVLDSEKIEEATSVVSTSVEVVQQNSIASTTLIDVSKDTSQQKDAEQRELYVFEGGTWQYDSTDASGDIGISKTWSFSDGKAVFDGYPNLQIVATYDVEVTSPMSWTLHVTREDVLPSAVDMHLVYTEDVGLFIDDDGPFVRKAYK